jgi:hypothetical protein
VSKKPKTPDVAAVWKEVAKQAKVIDAVAAANAKSFDRHDERIKRLGVMFDELQLEIAPRGFNRPPGNSVTERLDRLESERLTANRFASGLSDSLEKHAEQIGKHNAWLAGLQNAEIDAQGIGEQIGDLEVRVANLEPLHAAVSMLEAKTGNNRIEIEAALKRIDGAFRAIGRVEQRLDVIGPQVRSQSERMARQASRESLRSVVVVLVIVQAFTTIAGLAWVIGGGW